MRELLSDYFIALGTMLREGDNTFEACNVEATKEAIGNYINAHLIGSGDRALLKDFMSVVRSIEEACQEERSNVVPFVVKDVL